MVLVKNGKRIVINESLKDYYISKGYKEVKQAKVKQAKGEK